MRISYRPSGGRGDYELAGAFNTTTATDLVEKNILFQLPPNLIIHSYSKAHKLSGKIRIRPEKDFHPYYLIAALLLFPSPRRELEKTGNEAPIFLQQKNYILAGVDVRLLSQTAATVTFVPTNVIIRNQAGSGYIDFDERMASVRMIYEAAKITTNELSGLLLQHNDAIQKCESEKVVLIYERILKTLKTKNDPLQVFLQKYKISVGSDYELAGYKDVSAADNGEDEVLPIDLIKKDRIKKWRKQFDRGASGKKFRDTVKEAYEFKCLFSGEKYPKFEEIDSAPVEAAHILPWADSGLDHVTNGLCLNKMCHWAFDNGVFMFLYDDKRKIYHLSIPESIQSKAKENEFDLKYFEKCCGPIPSERLPKNRKQWPSPYLLEKLKNDNYSEQYH